jgi:hypothetical protein
MVAWPHFVPSFANEHNVHFVPKKNLKNLKKIKLTINILLPYIMWNCMGLVSSFLKRKN